MNTDYKQIDKILDKYFEGLTSLEEEKVLRKYFTSDKIAEKHLSYKDMFVYFSNHQSVTNPQPFRLNGKKKNHKKYIAYAAALVIGLGLFGVMQFDKKEIAANTIQISNNNPKKQQEAIKEIQKVSENVNQGLQKTGAISIFGVTTKKVFNLKKDKK
jgi:uncharacterized protein HemX